MANVTLVAADNQTPVGVPGAGGSLAVGGAGPAGQNTVGNPVFVGGWDGVHTFGLLTDGNGRLLTTVVPSGSAGGLSASRVLTGTTGVIKANPGELFAISAINLNAAVRYLHFYNKATAPTLGVDTPVASIPLSASGRFDINLGGLGLIFAAGISWAFTTDNVAIPTTAGASTELQATVFYV